MINSNNFSQSPLARPRLRFKSWLWFIAGALFLGLVISFMVAIFIEVDRRNQAVKDLLGLTDGQSDIINEDLISQLKNNFSEATSTETTTTNANLTKTENNLNLSQERKMAEKMNRPSLGNKASKLVIVEFADFECPTCLQAYPIIRTLNNKYEKDILFIFRNYPVLNENSQMLALAGFCAEEQAKFWQFHDKLFANQGQLNNLSDFKALAFSAGINWSKMEQCIKDEKYRDLLIEDMADALDLGVKGTPTFFVNGNKLEGAIPLATWEEIIKKAKELNK